MLGCACKAQLHSCFLPVSLYSGLLSTRQLASSVSSGFSASSPARNGCTNPFSFPFRPPIPNTWKTIEETPPFFKRRASTCQSSVASPLSSHPYFLTLLSRNGHPISPILNQSRASKWQRLTIVRLSSDGCSLWLFDRLLQEVSRKDRPHEPERLQRSLP